MKGPIRDFMGREHVRIEALLQVAAENPTRFDDRVLGLIRQGLVRHVAMVERVLLPFAARRDGRTVPYASKLRAEHRALESLVGLQTGSSLVAAVRPLMLSHHDFEEGPGGLYEVCDALAGADVAAVISQLCDVPNAQDTSDFDVPLVMETMRMRFGVAN